MIEAMARAVEVTIVPGNHDIYLPRVQREGRFARHFAPYFVSDLPELAVDVPAGRFPCVKLRGPVAIVGLSSAVRARPLFQPAASGGGSSTLSLVSSRTPRSPAARRSSWFTTHPRIRGSGSNSFEAG